MTALPRATSGQRGFTMVELIVAMAAGLIVASAAFILSKNATQFFTQESRASGAQLAATLGMNRLAADLQRAAFMSTPNIQTDVRTCSDKANWPVGLTQLAGVQITQGGSVALNTSDLDQSVANGLNPDSIIIGGSFHTTEQFAVRTIVPANGGLAVYLQTDSGPFRRTEAAMAAGGEGWDEIFAQGHFLRIVDAEGNHEYGVITGVTQIGQDVIVNLSATPALQQKTPGNTCGWSGQAVGLLTNPISRVRYELKSLAGDADYANITAPVSGAVTGDDGRTELVRSELDEQGQPVTTELVAEFAVDLKFGITVASPGATPVITRMPITDPDDGNIYTMAGNVTNNTAVPQRIRAVQVRLATRARVADRATDIPPGPDGRRARFLVATTPPLPSPDYARVRTLYADIALPNQTGAAW